MLRLNGKISGLLNFQNQAACANCMNSLGWYKEYLLLLRHPVTHEPFHSILISLTVINRFRKAFSVHTFLKTEKQLCIFSGVQNNPAFCLTIFRVKMLPRIHLIGMCLGRQAHSTVKHLYQNTHLTAASQHFHRILSKYIIEIYFTALQLRNTVLFGYHHSIYRFYRRSYPFLRQKIIYRLISEKACKQLASRIYTSYSVSFKKNRLIHDAPPILR